VRAKGNTDIPAAVASIGTGEIPTEVAALVSDDTTTIGGIPQSGNPEGLANGETDEGRKSETEANQAASPTIGDFSLPDTASELPTDTPGSSPESFPIADTASLAEIATTTAENPSDDLSGTASELNSTTVAEQATGQPGLPNQDVTPDEKTTVEGEPRPELAVTTPTEVFEGLETPALRNEQAQKLVDPDRP
jgi:hypothetical protein